MVSSEREIEAERSPVWRWLALLSRSEVMVGVLIAVGIIAGTLLAATPSADPPHPERPLDAAGGLLVVSAVVLVLALRRRFPVPALVAAMAAVNGYLLIGYPYGPFQLCIVVAMYEVARRRPLRVSLLICGVAAVVTSATVYARLRRDADIPWFWPWPGPAG